jgi:hypothetical protein
MWHTYVITRTHARARAHTRTHIFLYLCLFDSSLTPWFRLNEICLIRLVTCLLYHSHVTVHYLDIFNVVNGCQYSCTARYFLMVFILISKVMSVIKSKIL